MPFILFDDELNREMDARNLRVKFITNGRRLSAGLPGVCWLAYYVVTEKGKGVRVGVGAPRTYTLRAFSTYCFSEK